MNIISKEQLIRIYREADTKKVDLFLEPLNRTMEQYEINTAQRVRMFLAQIGHESGQLRYTEELASGQAYEGRTDLGNNQVGDGPRYKGRGLIQITGKRNYTLLGLALDLPLLEHPELLKELPSSCDSSGWFWKQNNLNALCDLGLFEKLTRRINGGLNGYADRYKLYQRAFEVIK
jgi:putative chitinase